jgi:peptidoglycan/LPS O-acetylase OafA/YrhL
VLAYRPKERNLSASTPFFRRTEPDRTAATADPATAPRAAPARPPDAPFHIPSLDGIRAISFSTVFLAHAGLGAFVPGYFGLNLFFFLSGFLITTLLRLEFDRTGDVSLRQFYLRRVLRIFPPFYLVLLVACFLTLLGATGGTLTTGAVVAQACHLVNYYIIRHGWWEGMAPGTWVYWSLAVEEHFYLFFPLAYLWLRRRGYSGRKQAALLLLTCALVLAWRCLLVFALHASKDRTYVATDTRVDSILAGCILAVFQNPVIDRDGPDDATLMRVWIPLGVAAIVLGLVIRVPRFEQTLRYTLQSFGLMPLFIAAMRWHDRAPFRLLNLAPIRRVGVLSYSMYLMHTSTLWGLERWTAWRTPVRGVVAFAFLVVVASLINKYIERPLGKMRHRLTRYLEPRGSA